MEVVQTYRLGCFPRTYSTAL